MLDTHISLHYCAVFFQGDRMCISHRFQSTAVARGSQHAADLTIQNLVTRLRQSCNVRTSQVIAGLSNIHKRKVHSASKSLLVDLLLGVTLGLPRLACSTTELLHHRSVLIFTVQQHTAMLSTTKHLSLVERVLAILPSACLASLPVTLATFFFKPPARESPAPSA